MLLNFTTLSFFFSYFESDNYCGSCKADFYNDGNIVQCTQTDVFMGYLMSIFNFLKKIFFSLF
jgi:hypothetical protein